MFKKVLVAVMMAVSFMAVTCLEAHAPPPQCNPCPWVN
jgi:hypothetical protein